MKKTIKINFCGGGDEFKHKNNVILSILNKYFNIVLCDDPDYIICGNGGIPFQYMKYDCIRIMVMTENFSPDFTLFDYCIGFDHLNFGDRYFRLPLAFQDKNGIPWVPETLSKEDAQKILNEKQYFCNFIFRHQSSHGIRESLFRKLSDYQYVVSPGNYLNNLDGKEVTYSNDGGIFHCALDDKYEYVKKSKFTIACDSVEYPGFVTEKIVDAFKGHSIPIYFGSPTVEMDFNPKAFIWCKSKGDIDNVVQRVIELDNDEEKYIEMLSECPLNNARHIENEYRKFEDFLIAIFSQPFESARRRPQYYYVDSHNARLRDFALNQEKYNSPRRRKFRNIVRKIKRNMKGIISHK